MAKKKHPTPLQMQACAQQARAAMRLGAKISFRRRGRMMEVKLGKATIGTVTSATGRALQKFMRSLTTPAVLDIEMDGQRHSIKFPDLQAVTAAEVAKAINQEVPGISAESSEDGLSIVLTDSRHPRTQLVVEDGTTGEQRVLFSAAFSPPLRVGRP